MLLSQIEYFKTIIETQSFSKAAELCNITQSAISQQIKALEAELGVLLLDRHNRTFTPTKAGEVFYRNALIVLSDVQRLRQDTIRAGKDDFTLRIGYNVCYGGNEFQNAVASFAAGSGVMPVEGIRRETFFDSAITLVPLFRGGKQITRKYCVFWKADNSGDYIEEFGDILKAQFE